MTLKVMIGGVDYGPTGENVVKKISMELAGTDKIGKGTIGLRYLEGANYDILNAMVVEAYDTDDIINPGFGYLAGTVADRGQDEVKGTSPRLLLDDVMVQDDNLALDTVVCGAIAEGATPIRIDAGTMSEQIVQLFDVFQKNGHANVNRPINVVDYVTDLVDDELPFFYMSGQSLRDGLARIFASVRAADAAINPGFNIQFRSNGVAILEPCLVVYDRAAVTAPSFVLATDADTGEGEYRIYKIARKTNSTRLTSAQQSIWGATANAVATFTNDDSQATYPNPYRNDGGDDNTGYWWMKPISDRDSTNSTDANNKLARVVKPKQFPIDSITITVDNIKIRPGHVVNLRIPERGIDSNYMVVGVSISWPKKNDTSYIRVAITLNSRRRGLFDSGEEGEALPPDEAEHVAPPPPTITDVDIAQDSPTFGHADVTVDWDDDPEIPHDWSGGGWVIVRPTGPGFERIVAIPAGSTFPYTATVPNLVIGQTWVATAIGINRYGQESDASEPVTFDMDPNEVDPPEIELVTPGGNVYDRRKGRTLIKIDRSSIGSEVVRTFLRVTWSMGGDSLEEDFDVNFIGDLSRVAFSVFAGAILSIVGFNVDIYGNVSEASDPPLEFTAAAATKPPPPNDLATGPVSGLSDANLPVLWTAPDDDDEEGIGDLIDSFRVTAKPSTWDKVKTFFTRKDEVSTEISGLPFDIETDVEVRTVDIWGNESDPATVVKTPALLGANLVINGTMEKPSIVDAGQPYFFRYDTDSNGDQVMQSDEQAYQGTQSLKITTHDIGVGITADAVSEWMYRPIVPGGTDLYTEGFWLFVDTDDVNTLIVNLITQDEDTGDPIYTELASLEYSGDAPWHYIELDDIAPGVTYLQRMALSFKIDNLTEESTFYIDNASFRQQLVTHLSPASDGTVRGEQFSPRMEAEANLNVTGRDILKPVVDAYHAEGADPSLPVIRADGLIESTTEGFKFPDDTIQTTAAVAPPYDLSGQVLGLPPDAGKIWVYVAPREFTLPSNLAGSYGWADSPPDGHDDMVFTIEHNGGANTWTMTIPFGASPAVFANGTATGDVVVAAGDTLKITAPSPQNGSMADIAWTLVGILT